MLCICLFLCGESLATGRRNHPPLSTFPSWDLAPIQYLSYRNAFINLPLHIELENTVGTRQRPATLDGCVFACSKWAPVIDLRNAKLVRRLQVLSGSVSEVSWSARESAGFGGTMTKAEGGLHF
ncbi:hypothetical protein BX600DRAFT_466866 [Xylariales sp. PMI_506]|nr:hypothetical protein BX600DRAFT_466866 [Xylariales sp. PMI_506]